MVRAGIIGSLLCLLALAAPVGADIFEWQDTSGVRHYTTEMSDVPEEFRATVATVAKDWVRAPPPPEEVARAASELEPTPPPPPVSIQSEDTAAPTAEESAPPENAQQELAAAQQSVVPPSADMNAQQGWVGNYLPLIGRQGPTRRLFRGEAAALARQPLPGPAGPAAMGAAGGVSSGAAGPPSISAAGPPPLGAAGRGR